MLTDFLPYIDEDTYRDTSIALDMMRSKHCPIDLQVLYMTTHPSVFRNAPPRTVALIQKEVEAHNTKAEQIHEIIDRIYIEPYISHINVKEEVYG